MKNYSAFMQRVAAPAGPKANFTITIQAVTTSHGQDSGRSTVTELQVHQRTHSDAPKKH